MSGLRAALYKDFKLFFSGAGLLALLLPILLIPVLRLGMGDLSGQGYVRPFPIAVRDLDDTLMSRFLIAQMEDIQLFSRIDRLEGSEADSAALDRGAAAVVTIPKDFFYDLYRMEDCPVEVTLNADMPLEAGLFQAIFRSVMGIIRADQTAALGAYTLSYGALSSALQDQMYAESAGLLLQDALGRQLVFDTDSQAADLAAALENRLLACILGVLALFFGLSVVKTLPEELALGVLSRFQAAGCKISAFWASKFLVALFLSLPTLCLCAAVFWETPLTLLLLLDVLLLFAAFGVFSALAAWTSGTQATQRWGNLLLLLSLALGGTLWPRASLPFPLPLLGKLTLPYYASLGLTANSYGMDMGAIVTLLWPLPAMGVLGLLLARLGFRRKARVSAPLLLDRPGTPPPQSPPLTKFPHRLAELSRFKLWAMAGGFRGMTAILIVCVVCGTAASSVRTGSVETLRLLICDLDRSPLSQELIERVTAAEGLSVTLCDEASSRRALLDSEAEGLLVISAGYADALEADASLPLHYQEELSARSAQGARELIAGMVSAQRSRPRAALRAADLLGRPLTEGERTALAETIDSFEEAMPPLFHIKQSRGAVLEDPFIPGQMSFASLAGLFTCLTAACWCGSRDSRLTRLRMSAIPRGIWLAYGSDCLALTALGMLSLLAVLIPGGEVPILAAAVYALCVSVLSLALTRLTALEGRVDALAPFLSLMLCLLGGCFMDLSQLSPRAELLTLIAPPGLAVRAAEGLWPAYVILGGQALACFALGFPGRIFVKRAPPA